MNGYTIANNFNHSILKNRIFMMEKETSTRRSLLRALYLLPLVCISLALNAQTKVNYVYDNAQSEQTPKKIVGRVTYDSDTLKYENLNPEKEIEWDANVYNSPEGKSADELIKSLPGVEFDEKGNLTVNGKAVRKILVNGKEYYSNAQEPIYANDIVDEVEGKTPEGYSRNIIVDVDKNDQVSITSEDKPDSKWNATAYRIPEGTNVEDLIKGLPGVEIDDDSSITVNGKPVSKVLVNGESYSPNFVNDKVSYDTVMEKEESSIGLWDKSIHVDYYKKCLTAIGITDDIYSLIVVPSGGGRVAEIKLGTKDEAIKAIENMISSYKTGNTLEIDGYTINGIKGKLYSISHTGPLERAISGSNYIFRIKGLKKIL
jgi:hypothetical protein